MTEETAVSVGGRSYSVSAVDGQIRVHLPFKVDVHAFTQFLIEEGHPVSHAPGTVTDTQGWGPDFEPLDYYPWFVYPDPDHPGGYCFAFSPRPEDVVKRVEHGKETLRVALTQESVRTVERWAHILRQFTHVPTTQPPAPEHRLHP